MARGPYFQTEAKWGAWSALTFKKNYLYERHQRVVLNGCQSDWKIIEAGVPQGSVLGPLHFLEHDLTTNWAH